MGREPSIKVTNENFSRAAAFQGDPAAVSPGDGNANRTTTSRDASDMLSRTDTSTRKALEAQLDDKLAMAGCTVDDQGKENARRANDLQSPGVNRSRDAFENQLQKMEAAVEKWNQTEVLWSSSIRKHIDAFKSLRSEESEGDASLEELETNIINHEVEASHETGGQLEMEPQFIGSEYTTAPSALLYDIEEILQDLEHHKVVIKPDAGTASAWQQNLQEEYPGEHHAGWADPVWRPSDQHHSDRRLAMAAHPELRTPKTLRLYPDTNSPQAEDDQDEINLIYPSALKDSGGRSQTQSMSPNTRSTRRSLIAQWSPSQVDGMGAQVLQTYSSLNETTHPRAATAERSAEVVHLESLVEQVADGLTQTQQELRDLKALNQRPKVVVDYSKIWRPEDQHRNRQSAFVAAATRHSQPSSPTKESSSTDLFEQERIRKEFETERKVYVADLERARSTIKDLQAELDSERKAAESLRARVRNMDLDRRRLQELLAAEKRRTHDMVNGIKEVDELKKRSQQRSKMQLYLKNRLSKVQDHLQAPPTKPRLEKAVTELLHLASCLD